jgi:hypothetical protein
MLKTVSAIATQIISSITGGLVQFTGPAAGTTRVITVPNANATMARTDAAQSFTGDQTLSTGNLVIGTSGKGIDFSATPGTGTSELFADYEEGTFTPTVTAFSGSITTVSAVGTYTKIGRNVIADIKITITDNGTGGTFLKTTLPFVPTSVSSCGAGRENNVTGIAVVLQNEASVNNANIVTVTNTYPGGTGYVITATLTYFV